MSAGKIWRFSFSNSCVYFYVPEAAIMRVDFLRFEQIGKAILNWRRGRDDHLVTFFREMLLDRRRMSRESLMIEVGNGH